jgi:hypothetical protein
VTVENGCRWKRWVVDTSGTRHHQLGGSYLPERAAGEVLPDHHWRRPHLRDSYEARCGYLLLPLRFEPDRISRHGTTAHVLLLVSSWRSWPASLTAMSLAVVPSLYPH